MTRAPSLLFFLSKSHPYFYQVQGQLYCSDKQACHFVMCTISDIKVNGIFARSNMSTALEQDANMEEASLSSWSEVSRLRRSA